MTTLLRPLSLAVAATIALTQSAVAQENAATQVKSPPQLFAGVSYEYRDFFGDIAPWHLASVEAGSRLPTITAIARGNYARRFGASAAQGELDAYPRFGERSYAYLNAGYGEEPLFPRWRWGAELFSVTHEGWEGSLGMRQLHFTSMPVSLYTVSLGRYSGDYWISLRPWLSHANGISTGSLTLTARRYTADADHFVGLQLGAGRTPTDRVLLSDLSRTSAVSAAIDGSGGPWQGTILTWSIGAEHEQLPSARTRSSLILSAGVRRRF